MARLIFAILFLLAAVSLGAQPEEAIFQDLPPGVILVNSITVPESKTTAIGQKLGGEIAHLTNSVLKVHGRQIQVNVVTAADKASADAIYAFLRKLHPEPYCLRDGLRVVEFTGKHVDEALVQVTSYELGLVTKPLRVTYRVHAQIATVDSLDYMSCNPMFNLLATLDQRPDSTDIEDIKSMGEHFRFGSTLTLRNPNYYSRTAYFTFDPAPTEVLESGPTTRCSYGKLPSRAGVPYANVTLEITVESGGLTPAEAPSKDHVAATPAWPSDAPAILDLARKIVGEARTNDEKVSAILEWLTPGKNITYSGEVGSRWGTNAVLEQGFGHCWDFADCFVTLARATGVPSRQVAGWLYGSSGHVWAEYYREGRGWQQVDPTGGGHLACGIYHIPYFTTVDGEMPILYVATPHIEVVETD